MPGKEKARVLHSSSNVRLFSAKQRQKKPSRTTAFQSIRDTSANRRPKLMLTYNVPQLYAGRDYNYRTSCKALYFNLILSCQQSAETRLADSCCCRAAFPVRPGLKRSIQGYCPTGALFLRMKICPAALSRNKEKLRVLQSASNGRICRTKQRQKKPARTTAFQSMPVTAANRKTKINVTYNVRSYTQGGNLTTEFPAKS